MEIIGLFNLEMAVIFTCKWLPERCIKRTALCTLWDCRDMNGFKVYRGKLGQSVGKYNLIVRTSEHWKGLPEA